ncbi:MAG: rod shape-determining protein MreC [Firmicutes bacterium]|nr:rod shape-determining protein MreC [Bacillota bacterium]
MVIYLYKKRVVILKIISFILLFIFLYGLSYFSSYVKYKDRYYVELDGLRLENQILKKELNDLSKIKYDDGVIAKVILRDMYSFYDELVINVGSKDNINIYDSVICNGSLVGIVTKVNDNTSNVKLISSNYNISVKIGNTYGNLNKGIVTMIDKYSDISVGDLVYTSGLDNILGNIYIGKVKDISLDEDGLSNKVIIEYEDNNYLNYVYVVGKIS